MKTEQTRLTIFLICILFCTAGLFGQAPNWKRDFVFVKGGIDTVRIEQPHIGTTATDTILLATTEIKGFYIAATCVSVSEYQYFCRQTNRTMPPPPPWGWDDLKKPMVNVSYSDALEYCSWFFEKYGMAVRLPEDQQWVYASHNGLFSDLYDYTLPNIEHYAEYNGNNRISGEPNCITCRQPNALGIYDMWGNVWEWVGGFFHSIGDTSSIPLDGQGMIIGGSHLSPEEDMHSDTKRMLRITDKSKDIGFRIVAGKKDWDKKFFPVKNSATIDSLAIVKNYLESIHETLNNNEIYLKQKVTVLDSLIGLGSMKEKVVK